MVLSFFAAAARGRAKGIVGALFAVAVSFFYLVPAISGATDLAEANSKYAGIVIDANNGKVLYANDADAKRYPASLTKIMTLYIMFEEIEAGRLTKATRLKVSKHAAGQAPSKLGFKPGQTISVEEAILALVTKSANDVAVVVAENIGGTESAFARRMTQTARRLGMKRTTFRNASGLPDRGQVTTARDMATLGLRVQRDFPRWYPYFSTREFTYRGKSYRTHNRLLGRFAGTDGIKTGYTRASGFNLTSSVRRDGKHLVGVVLGGRTGARRDRQMETLLANALPKATVKPKVTKPEPKIAAIPVPVPNPKLVSTLTDSDKSVPDKPLDAIAVAIADASGTAVLAADTEEGDAEPEAADALTAAKEGSGADAAGTDGTWSIQIGAYYSADDARRRLGEAKQTGVKTLDGKKGLTLSHQNSDRVIYRARFAGFDRASAKKTCTALTSKSINCFTLAP